MLKQQSSRNMFFFYCYYYYYLFIFAAWPAVILKCEENFILEKYNKFSVSLGLRLESSILQKIIVFCLEKIQEFFKIGVTKLNSPKYKKHFFFFGNLSKIFSQQGFFSFRRVQEIFQREKRVAVVGQIRFYSLLEYKKFFLGIYFFILESATDSPIYNY